MLFTKMHGLGNDFIIIDGLDGQLRDYNAIAVKICDRRTSIGADGILVVLPSLTADVRMRIVNSDGSEAEMCGNGIRCFAKYVFEKGIVQTPSFKVETLAGIMEPELILKNGEVSAVKVNMGRPGLKRTQIPMLGSEERVLNEPISVENRTYYITSLLMGVPHTIVFVKEFDEKEIEMFGPVIEHYPAFTQRTNVNFVKILNYREIEVKTWERGAGRTLACGTGACASSVAAFLNGYTGRKVIAHLALGNLTVEWAEDDTVYMTGPAEESFVGEISFVE